MNNHTPNHTPAVVCAECPPRRPLFFQTTSGKIFLVMQALIVFYLLVAALMWLSGLDGWAGVKLAACIEVASYVTCLFLYRAHLRLDKR